MAASSDVRDILELEAPEKEAVTRESLMFGDDKKVSELLRSQLTELFCNSLSWPCYYHVQHIILQDFSFDVIL